MSVTKPSAVVTGKASGENAYNVLLSIGSSAVAVAVHEAGFVTGEEATVIQVGDKYGIMKFSTTLPGVLQVPDAALQTIAEENIAAFTAAYIGYQLGRLARLYVSALVTAVAVGYVRLTFSEGTLAGQTGRLDTAPGSGLVPRDFLVGDSVVAALHPAVGVAGWWHRGDYPDVPCIIGVAEAVAILLCDENGEWIKEADPDYWPIVTVEWGEYDEVSGTEWEYLAYKNSANVESSQSIEGLNGPLACAIPSAVIIPNSFRISFTYRETAYTATLSADKRLQPRGSMAATISTDGSVEAYVETAWPRLPTDVLNEAESPSAETTLLDGFACFGATFFSAGAGFADNPPSEDPFELSQVVAGGADIDLKTGYANGNGEFSFPPQAGVAMSGSWRLRAFLQYRRPPTTLNAQCTGHAVATVTDSGGITSGTVTGAGAVSLSFQGVMLSRPYKSEIIP
jgi:hypothetical protein